MYQLPSYIVDNKHFLHQIAYSKSERNIQKLINSANSDQILAISEIIFNILKGNFPLKNRQRKKLSEKADYFRQIARARSETSARKRIQTGGQLGALSAILAPVIGYIAQNILDKSLKNK
jgi:superfamily I DNA/RNA helicase